MAELDHLVFNSTSLLPQIQLDLIDNIISINNAPNINCTNNKKRSYGNGKEAIMIRGDIGDFDLVSSEAMKLIKRNFGESLRLTELKGIINAVREHLSKKGIYLPRLSRNANRSFQLCVKYVQDNLEWMRDILPYVKLCDNEGTPISVN